MMPSPSLQPDDFFKAEFGEGELAKRLWQGGLRASEEGYTIEKDTYVLTNTLQNGLDARFTEDGIVEQVMSDIESCWNDIGRLKRACFPITGARVNTYSGAPVSLVKHILSIDLFQPAMITTVVNKISELGEENSHNREISQVLLNQLRWLPFIVDGSSLCESLLSILPIVSLSLQKDIIEAMPEILDDDSKAQAVTELIRILEETPALMGSIIDALASLGVDEERLADVNTSIISTLGAANRDILPITIKYLLRTCPPDLVVPTVNALRNTLAVPSLGAASGRLCLDSVMRSLRTSKHVAQHIIKTLRNTEKEEGFKPADLWMILALYDSPINRKPMEIVFKRKAATGCISAPLIDAALAPFADAFADFTSLIITIASVVLKSPQICARKTGVCMYAKLFKLFPSGTTRRNVISSLVEHSSSRKPVEVDTALNALVVIAKESVIDRSLLPYSAAIQNLLDNLETFSDFQLRQLWSVLGYLCCSSSKRNTKSSSGGSSKDKQRKLKNSKKRNESSDDNSDKENEIEKSGQGQAQEQDGDGEQELQMLEILLRKELNHPDTFYRRIGVIGACTMIKILGDHVENNILHLLLDVGRTHPFSEAVAFDQLSELLHEQKSGSKSTSERLHRTIHNMFDRKYIRDRDKLSNLMNGNELLLPAEMYGNLEDEEPDFCFSIASLTRNQHTLKDSHDSVRSMVPCLRLICVLTKLKDNGSLSSVDALIGAPIHIPMYPKDKDIEEISADGKKDLLLNLFLTHGWLVELVNGYAEQENAELRAKCVMRLDNVMEIMSQVSELVSKVPTWKDVIFDMYNGTREDIQSQLKMKQAMPPRKKKAGGKEKATDNSTMIEWKKWSRQLNPCALSMIRIRNPITYRYTEAMTTSIQEGEPDYQSVMLSTKALHYLLVELAGYVKGVVGTSFRTMNAFAVTMFHSPSVASGKKESRSSDACGIDGGLNTFHALRTALESLGPQLKRCLDKLFSGSDSASQREDDADMKLFRECAVLCLQSLSLSLNSSVLNDTAAQELLFHLLASIRLDGESAIEASDPMTNEDVEIAAKTAFNQIYIRMQEILGEELANGPNESESRADSVTENPDNQADELQLDGCCAMLATMDSLFQFCAEKHQPRLGEKLSGISKSIMKHTWCETVLRQKKTQKLIPGIVRLYIQYAKNPLTEADKLQAMITTVSKRQNELNNQKRVNSQDVERTGLTQVDGHGSLTVQTVYAYSVAILEQYIFLFKQFKPDSYDNFQDAYERMMCFIRAEDSLYRFGRLNQELLGPVMKAGRLFVEIFLQNCLPYLNNKFKTHRAEVLTLCRMHQKSSRLLQQFCAHSKSTRNTSLTSLVPPLRRCLELVVYRVKSLFRGHNASAAFQLGNLKHRDIHGALVHSQQMEEEPEEAQEEEEAEEARPEDEEENGAILEEDGERIVSVSDNDEDENEEEEEPSRKVKKLKPKRKEKNVFGSAKKKRSRLSEMSKGKGEQGKKRKTVKKLNHDDDDGDDEEGVDEMLSKDIALDAPSDDDSDQPNRTKHRRDLPESVEGISGGLERRDTDRTQRKRCRLIDDEAGAGGSELDDDEYYNASNFIVDDNEVEEEQE